MKISQIQIKKMWGKQDIEWNHVDPKVNILVGPNGSGKSTFLRFIYLLLTSDIKELNKLKTDIFIRFDAGGSILYHADKKDFSIEFQKDWLSDIEYINTFDIPTAKKSAQSSLMQELDMTIYPLNKNVFNFIDYRSKILNYPEQSEKIQERILMLFKIINRFLQALKSRSVSIQKTKWFSRF
ncbi:AAA family ATPase [Bacteroides fragilis]